MPACYRNDEVGRFKQSPRADCARSIEDCGPKGVAKGKSDARQHMLQKFVGDNDDDEMFRRSILA